MGEFVTYIGFILWGMLNVGIILWTSNFIEGNMPRWIEVRKMIEPR